ncbi:MAG: glycerol-3-phosphate transporter, partial [Kiloniellaceae bacterium]
MIENRPWLTVFAHVVLLLGIGTVAFPIYVTIVAASHTAEAMMQVPIPLVPGDQFWVNLRMVMFGGIESIGGQPVGVMMWNSLVMALMIAIGKIAISLISAYAIVYFRFPFRMGFFWMIFVTLMLPVE